MYSIDKKIIEKNLGFLSMGCTMGGQKQFEKKNQNRCS
jgi:hypothetical protein